jgi:hypothetical protein
LIPESYSPLADTMPGEKLVFHLDEFRTEIQDRVEEMRRHDRFVERYCAAEPSATPFAAEARL